MNAGSNSKGPAGTMSSIWVFSVAITVESATDLPIADYTTSDPFVSIYLDEKFIGQTSTKYKTLNPVWQDKIDPFTLTHINHTLRIKIMDEDKLNIDEAMGKCSIDLSTLLTNNINTITLPLEQVDGGRIHAKGALTLTIEIKQNSCIYSVERSTNSPLKIQSTPDSVMEELKRISICPDIFEEVVKTWINEFFPSESKSFLSFPEHASALRDVLLDTASLLPGAFPIPEEYLKALHQSTDNHPLTSHGNLVCLPFVVRKVLSSSSTHSSAKQFGSAGYLSTDSFSQIFHSLKNKVVILPGDFYTQVEVVSSHLISHYDNKTFEDVGSDAENTSRMEELIRSTHPRDPHLTLSQTTKSSDKHVLLGCWCGGASDNVVDPNNGNHLKRGSLVSQVVIKSHNASFTTRKGAGKFPVWMESTYFDISDSYFSINEDDGMSYVKNGGFFVFLYEGVEGAVGSERIDSGGGGAVNNGEEYTLAGYQYVGSRRILFPGPLEVNSNTIEDNDIISEIRLPMNAKLDLHLVLQSLEIDHPYFNINSISTVSFSCYFVRADGSKVPIPAHKKPASVDLSPLVHGKVDDCRRVTLVLNNLLAFEQADFVRIDVTSISAKTKRNVVLGSALLPLEAFHVPDNQTVLSVPLYSLVDIYQNDYKERGIEVDLQPYLTSAVPAAAPASIVTVGIVCLQLLSNLESSSSEVAASSVSFRLRSLANNPLTSFWHCWSAFSTESEKERYLFAPGYDGIVLNPYQNQMLQFGNRVPLFELADNFPRLIGNSSMKLQTQLSINNIGDNASPSSKAKLSMSSPTSQSPSKASAATNIVSIFIVENQRNSSSRGWIRTYASLKDSISKNPFQPFWPPFTDFQGNSANGIFNLFEALPPENHIWTTDWEVAREFAPVDVNGWIYATFDPVNGFGKIHYDIRQRRVQTISLENEISHILRSRVWIRQAIMITKKNQDVFKKELANPSLFVLPCVRQHYDGGVNVNFDYTASLSTVSSQSLSSRMKRKKKLKKAIYWRHLALQYDSNNNFISKAPVNILTAYMNEPSADLSGAARSSSTHNRLYLVNCKERNSMTGPIAIPYSQLDSVTLLSRTELVLQLRINRYVDFDNSEESSGRGSLSDKDAIFREEEIVLNITNCPAEALASLIESRREFFKLRNEVLDQQREEVLRGSAANSAPALVEILQNIYGYKMDLERSAALQPVLPSNPGAPRKLSYLELRVLRSRMYYASLLARDVPIEHSFDQPSLKRVIDEDFAQADTIVLTDEIGTSLDRLENLFSATEYRILSLALGGWATYRRDISLPISSSKSRSRTFLSFKIDKSENSLANSFETCLEVVINQFYVKIISILGMHFDKVMDAGSRGGVESAIKLLLYFIRNDDRIEKVLTEALTMYPMVALSPKHPLLSDILKLGNIVSWFADACRSEMIGKVDNAVQIWIEPGQDSSGNASIYIFLDSMPWLAKRSRGREGFFFTEMSSDVGKVLDAFLSVYTSFVTEATRADFQAVLAKLEGSVHLSYIASWMHLYNVYWKVLSLGSTTANYFSYPNISWTDDSSPIAGHFELHLGKEPNKSSSKGKPDAPSSLHANTGSSPAKAAAASGVPLDPKNVIGDFINEKMDFLSSVANDCCRILTDSLIQTHLVACSSGDYSSNSNNNSNSYSTKIDGLVNDSYAAFTAASFYAVDLLAGITCSDVLVQHFSTSVEFVDDCKVLTSYYDKHEQRKSNKNNRNSAGRKGLSDKQPPPVAAAAFYPKVHVKISMKSKAHSFPVSKFVDVLCDSITESKQLSWLVDGAILFYVQICIDKIAALCLYNLHLAWSNGSVWNSGSDEVLQFQQDVNTAIESFSKLIKSIECLEEHEELLIKRFGLLQAAVKITSASVLTLSMLNESLEPLPLLAQDRRSSANAVAAIVKIAIDLRGESERSMAIKRDQAIHAERERKILEKERQKERRTSASTITNFALAMAYNSSKQTEEKEASSPDRHATPDLLSEVAILQNSMSEESISVKNGSFMTAESFDESDIASLLQFIQVWQSTAPISLSAREIVSGEKLHASVYKYPEERVCTLGLDAVDILIRPASITSLSQLTPKQSSSGTVKESGANNSKVSKVISNVISNALNSSSGQQPQQEQAKLSMLKRALSVAESGVEYVDIVISQLLVRNLIQTKTVSVSKPIVFLEISLGSNVIRTTAKKGNHDLNWNNDPDLKFRIKSINLGNDSLKIKLLYEGKLYGSEFMGDVSVLTSSIDIHPIEGKDILVNMESVKAGTQEIAAKAADKPVVTLTVCCQY